MIVVKSHKIFCEYQCRRMCLRGVNACTCTCARAHFRLICASVCTGFLLTFMGEEGHYFVLQIQGGLGVRVRVSVLFHQKIGQQIRQQIKSQINISKTRSILSQLIRIQNSTQQIKSLISQLKVRSKVKSTGQKSYVNRSKVRLTNQNLDLIFRSQIKSSVNRSKVRSADEKLDQQSKSLTNTGCFIEILKF